MSMTVSFEKGGVAYAAAWADLACSADAYGISRC